MVCNYRRRTEAVVDMNVFNAVVLGPTLPQSSCRFPGRRPFWVLETKHTIDERRGRYWQIYSSNVLNIVLSSTRRRHGRRARRVRARARACGVRLIYIYIRVHVARLAAPLIVAADKSRAVIVPNTDTNNKRTESRRVNHPAGARNE